MLEQGDWVYFNGVPEITGRVVYVIGTSGDERWVVVTDTTGYSRALRERVVTRIDPATMGG